MTILDPGEILEGELDDPVKDRELSSLEKMQALVDKHEQEGLHRIENRELRMVLDEIRSVALSNIIDLFESNPITGALQIRDISKIDRSVMAGVKSIKVRRDKLDGDLTETVEFQMHDKIAALDKLMRYHGAYIADNSQKSSKEDELLDMVLSFIGDTGMPSIEDNSA